MSKVDAQTAYVEKLLEVRIFEPFPIYEYVAHKDQQVLREANTDEAKAHIASIESISLADVEGA